MFKRSLLVLESGSDADVVIYTGASMACACSAELLLYTGLGHRPLPESGLPNLPNAVAATQWAALDDELLQTERLHERAREFALGLGVLSRSMIDTVTDPMRSVVDTAQQNECDLIVIAGERHNAVVRLLNGSLIPGLVSASPVPVMVCAHRLPNRPAGADIDRILIILQDDDLDASPCAQGLDLARELAAELDFVHVMPSGLAPVVDVSGLFTVVDDQFNMAIECQSQQRLASACKLAREMGLTAHGNSLPTGTPAKDIAHMAAERDCKLIVVGHHGGSALARLLSGSPVPGLITAGELPVLICPPVRHERRGGAA